MGRCPRWLAAAQPLVGHALAERVAMVGSGVPEHLSHPGFGPGLAYHVSEVGTG